MRLTLASYNVHSFVGTDGLRDVPRLTAVVRGINADVIALQEVAFADHEERTDELMAGLPGYRLLAAPIQRRDGVWQGNVVLSRLPVTSSRRICLDFEKHEPRTAIEAWLETGSRPLRVVATHLGLRPDERRFQVREILKHVAGDEKSVTVLLGDFNEWFLVGRPLRWLHQRFGRSRSVATFPSRFPVFALDRIWVHPPGSLQRVSALSNEQTRRASDHLPVIAEVAI